jgi:serine/threonine-protein kinase
MSADVIANKYRILREIARSNDIVYEALDTTMGRRLAVKELNIPPNLVGQARAERIERFNREAKATGKLSHPNIVTVYDYGSDGKRYFIAMEYLEGSTLREVLQQRTALPVHEVVDIGRQILAALSHAHSQKVVHRDVKPDNIYILPGGQVKLTDFGIARLTEEASLTGDGQVFGTPSYMSPEQIKGGVIDHRSDLFSTGIVLYEMLAGRKPFTGDSVVTITYNILNNEPLPLVGVPFEVENVVARAMHKDPFRRFGSADEMRTALQNASLLPPVFGSPGMSTHTGFGAPRQPTFGGSAFPPFNAQPGAALPPVWTPAAGMTGGIPTSYAPPPQSAPPPTAGIPQNMPFLNWGGTGLPAGGAPAPGTPFPPLPPIIRRPAGPILSPGARTFLASLMVALIIGGVIAGMALLFITSYRQNKERGSNAVVEKQLADGNQLYNAGRVEEAVLLYQAILKASPGSAAGKAARTSLATAYNRLGMRAFEQKRYDVAERLFTQTIDLYTPDTLVATKDDRTELENANYNLSKVYEVLGDPKRAAERRERMRSVPDPSAPADQSGLGVRIQNAVRLLQEGNRLYQSGDLEGARERWSRVLNEAPGTDAALSAQQFLNQTQAAPNF